MSTPDKQITQYIGEAPQPLVREIPNGADYPVEALGPLKDVVKAVQGETQAPVAIPAASALAAASLAVQGFADVETLGGPRPVSLYLLTVAQSGERKSSCDKPLLAGLREHEREKAEAYETKLKSWRKDVELYDANKKGILRDTMNKKADTRNAAKVDMDALGDEPQGPILPDRTVSEPTLEGLFRAFLEGQPSLGVFSDEAAQFLGGHGMNADNRMKTLGGLNSLWDGSEIKRTRAGDGVYTMRGRRLALHLMVQPVVAHDFLSDGLASGVGFLPRCLICEPSSTIGMRFSNNAKKNPMALTNFSCKLKSILEREMPTWDDGRTLKPRHLPLALEAKMFLVDFSDNIEAEQAAGGDFAHITGDASKAAEHAARIAGVLTLWNNPDAYEVDAETMADAITLAQFYLSEASRLASVATISKAINQADKLQKWLCNNWKHPEITVRDVVQFGPNALRESPKARTALVLLANHGWLVPLEKESVVRGAPRKEAWRIVKGSNHVV
jgi:hypothetical protein